MTKERLSEKNEAQVERWNRNHPIGTLVNLDGPSLAPRKTTSAAFMHEQRPCIFLSGFTLAVPLDWIRPCA